ncbi:MAG: transaldolase [Gammaproteobacteria bacterium]|nr:transaldolase [Gammaproteobacteria bacterium]
MATAINLLRKYGQSFWYDNIERNMLQNGKLAQMIREDDLRGITSNPSIFEKAINGSKDYDDSLARLALEQPSLNSRDYFYQLAVEDIKHAADLLAHVYKESHGEDGYVSIEVSPDLAYNTSATIKEARELFKRIDRPNVMIKVPATWEGVPAVEQLIADGININATLLFSVDRYIEIAHAYIAGLQKRKESGQAIDKIASVASFFVSRVDNILEKLVDELPSDVSKTLASLRGQIGILNAKCAYVEYGKLFGNSFKDLAKSGARPQRLLWASTGVKNPDWSDVLYIDSLIGAHTVNTIPPATLDAFKDHGTATQATLEMGLKDAPAEFHALQNAGIDVKKAMQKLEDDGVASFTDAFKKLLGAIDDKMSQIKNRQSSSAA